MRRAETAKANDINNLIAGGAGGIRTHATLTRTTVFEFYDSHVGLCRSVAKRVLLFAISQPIIPTCYAQCRSVPHSWFAIWFANSPPGKGRVSIPSSDDLNDADSQAAALPAFSDRAAHCGAYGTDDQQAAVGFW